MITLTKEAAQSVLDALEGVTAYTALLDDFTMAAAKESAEVLQAAIDAPEQEPVGWLTQAGAFMGPSAAVSKNGALYGWKRLYLAPPAPQARELSDEQIEAAAKVLAKCMDFPWEHMPEQGWKEMRKHARAVLTARSEP